jgi:hypothetical protein
MVGGDKGLGGLVDKLAGGDSKDKTVPVQIQIGGTMSDPEVEIVNREAVRSGIRGLAKEAGLRGLRNLFDGGN